MASNKSSRELSKQQKNQVATLATALGLALSDFEWTLIAPGDYIVSKLTHRPTGSWFEFDVGGGGLWSRWWPEPMQAKSYSGIPRWDDQLRLADRWLQFVVTEHTTPDLWALAQAERNLLRSSAPFDDSSNKPFTGNERAAAKEGIEELRLFLLQAGNAQAESTARIEAELAYLRNAVDRLGRFDFRGVLAGALLDLALQAGLSKENANAFLTLATAKFGPLFGWLKAITTGS